MGKRAFIIHGWDGYPGEAWFPWLKAELEKKNFEVYVPAMPNSEEPEINSWTEKLKEIIGKADEDTYLIGHSIGCQTIMRYLEKLNDGEKVGGVVFVAGFFNLPSLKNEGEEVYEIGRPWLETKIDTDKVKEKIKDGKIVAIFSDDDHHVPLSDKNIFEERLNAKTIIVEGKGHMGANDDVPELTLVLKEILKISDIE